MAEDQFDLVVVGGGPGGYVAAIRASQLGLRVALVERRENLGGVCLHEGCIPSKTLLEASSLYARTAEGLEPYGIEVSTPKLHLDKLMTRKNAITDRLSSGIAALMKKNASCVFRGEGRLIPNEDGAHQVAVVLSGQEQILKAPRVLLATGSEAVEVPEIPFEEGVVLSAREALNLTKVPRRLLVLGGGYIGLELGSVWRRLGAEVIVVERLGRLLPAMDRFVAEALHDSLSRQGMTFRLKTRVTAVRKTPEGLAVTLENQGQGEELMCDHILVAVGRKPLSGALQEMGIATDSRGHVIVNGDYETSVPGVYAIGDLIPGPMLAHKAMDEGVAFAEKLKGIPREVEALTIPGIIYTWPEASFVGQTQQSLEENQIPYVSGRFNFSSNPRALCLEPGRPEGAVKVLADPETGKILGVHIFGPQAGEMIAEATTLMAFGASVQDVGLTCHPHPSFSEALREACLAVTRTAIHS